MSEPLHHRWDSLRILTTLAIAYTLFYARELILPLLLATMAALLFGPLVSRLQRIGIPRGFGALAIVVLLIAAMVGTVWTAREPVMQWLSHLPTSVADLGTRAKELTSTLSTVESTGEEMDQAVKKLLPDSSDAIVVREEPDHAGQLFRNSVKAIGGLSVGLTLLYFLLASGHRLIERVGSTMRPRQRRKLWLVVGRLERETAAYLGTITMINLSVGVASALYLWALGLPDPVLWGAVVALLRFVPYLGMLLAGGLVFAVAHASLEDFSMILAAPLGVYAVGVIVGLGIEPLIHGQRLRLNPIAIFLAVFFFGWVWGMAGTLLAVPLLTIGVVVLSQFQRTRNFAEIIRA